MLRALWQKLRKRLGLVNHGELKVFFTGINQAYKDNLIELLTPHDLTYCEELSTKVATPLNTDATEEAVTYIESNASKTYKIWQKLQEKGIESYDGFPVDSCSVEGHRNAELFKVYIQSSMRGSVLDIGCGPQAIPEYLRGYPEDLIAGIDPIDPEEEHPFMFSKAYAESIPWPDNSFDNIVIGTSLDHVILLDRAYKEFQRVLKPGGKLYIWISFLPGSKTYDPYDLEIKPVDDFHLFHFDRNWFEDGIKESFSIENFIPLLNLEKSVGFYESFYILSNKKSS